MIDAINLQRKVKVEAREFRRFLHSLPELVSEMGAATFSVAFVSDRKMQQLNKQFRDIDATTDVLSFPFLSEPPAGERDSGFLGDIAISVEQAQRQAIENGLTLENEIKQLILHGLLHLCGYDHETDSGEMNDREMELRENIGI